MHIGYAQNLRDERILLDSGIKPERIYLEGRGAETLARVRLRSGDELHAVHGLRALGDARYDIVAEVKRSARQVTAYAALSPLHQVYLTAWYTAR